ncbi:hypothetical protein [Marinitoga aeolica]|uniref:Ig-like domain-containing protein n=1 Tax=Marinitoga aeolica TaxID=2809031 RepID=A0ABY8PP27_9BACT|nr:hypothetical protein [Marinitoga aeolica]WGS64377.1 hypothetical protein JRV97_08345 [Marinitoga aeolica]
MKKFLLFIFLLILFIFQSCSIFNTDFKKNSFDKIVKNNKKFNVSIKNNKFIVSKRFRIPFKVYALNTYSSTPSEVIDKIKILPETKNATIKIYKNYLDFSNFTTAGTYTVLFYHSKISTSLTLTLFPDKPEKLNIETPENIFFASEKVKIPFKLYYTDQYGNKILNSFDNISIFPYVKNTIKKIDNENYELELYNITKPGKYIFTLQINNLFKKNISFKIISGSPNSINFEKNTIYLATYYDDTSHFPPKNAVVKYTLLDKFGNITKLYNLKYKIISENILNPKINIKNNNIEIISNVYPGKYKIEFYYNDKKLNGTLEINIISIPRKIIFIDKDINNSIYLSFAIQDGNTNFANNIIINKIIIRTNKTQILINDKLNKYLKRKDNIFILDHFPLNDYSSNIEITFYISSKIFNYTKKITEKLY